MGPRLAAQVDGLAAILRLCDDRQLGLIFQQRGQPAAENAVISLSGVAASPESELGRALLTMAAVRGQIYRSQHHDL